MIHAALFIDGLPVVFLEKQEMEAIESEFGLVVLEGEPEPHFGWDPVVVTLMERLGDRARFGVWNGPVPIPDEDLNRAMLLYYEHVAPVLDELRGR